MKDITREQVLAEFEGIRRAQRRGVFAPHKPLLLLTALAHLQRGAPRLESFIAYDSDLKDLLAKFGPSSAAGSRHYPFWHLRTDGGGQLWSMQGPASLVDRPPASTPNLGELRTDDIRAGFSPAVHAALARDPALVQELARRLLDATFPETLHEDVAQAAGLDMRTSWVVSEIESPGYETIVKRRRRDAAFRELVLRAYEYRCCVCGFDLRVCHQPVGIEAAHIQWHTADGPDVIGNGISLCATHHKMFDMGAFTIEPLEKRVLLSQHAMGAGQMQFHGKPMLRPMSDAQLPESVYLNWNLKSVFKTPARP